MQHRNTPDPDTRVSPAHILFGRPIKDFMPIKPYNFMPQKGWRLAQEDREEALRVRYCRGKERLSEHIKKLPKLSVGVRVLIQNQCGTPKVAKRWDRSGVVLEVMRYDKYKVKVDGSGRITMGNRQLLRKVLPYQPQQPVQRAKVKTDLEVQGDGAVDMGLRKEWEQVQTMQEQVQQEQTTQEHVRPEQVQQEQTMQEHVQQEEVQQGQVQQETRRSGRQDS